MPEMTEENYKALLERLDNQDKLIAEQTKKIADIVAMNRVLLQTSDDGARVQPTSERHKELEDKLKGGLRHA